MADVLLEVILNGADLVTAGIEGRDEVEDPLHEALVAAGLGGVTGGGGGSGVSVLDVEIEDERRIEEALSLMRRVLRDIGVPPSTVVKRYRPRDVTYAVYE